MISPGKIKEVTGKTPEEHARFTEDPRYLLTLLNVIHNDGVSDGVQLISGVLNYTLRGCSHEGSHPEAMARVP